MPIRCPKCGYSNDAEFRFCGMCGAPLNRQYDEPIRPKPSPPPASSSAGAKEAVSTLSAPPQAQPRAYRDEARLSLPRIDLEKRDYSPVNGPSFLGLDPSRASVDEAPQYLLEDEEPSGRGKFLFGVVLALAIAGGLFWQWQHEGYPWNPEPKAVTSSVGGETTEPAPSSSPDSSQLPAAVTPEPAKPEGEVAVDKATNASASDEAKPEEKSSEASSPAASSDVASPPTDEAKPEPKVAKAVVPSPTPKLKREVAGAAPAPAPDPSEALFIDGQKYLYGSGVPEDCGRARSKLIAAAGQSNAKAQSTLATMYATGHCLPRSLPSAYHWFAQALHNDRDNGRLQRDLEMIWGQMTPEEKEMAIKSR